MSFYEWDINYKKRFLKQILENCINYIKLGDCVCLVSDH